LLLRWTNLAGALSELGRQVSDSTVAKLLRGLGCRLQADRKTRERTDHPDRDRQFEHIDQTGRAAIVSGQPVISVDNDQRVVAG
jgi:Rhodopirellula transposase DDE domain